MTFDEAPLVFYDDHCRLIPDPDSSIGEKRFILLGQSQELKTLLVCHCYRDAEQTIRIIFLTHNLIYMPKSLKSK